MKRLFSVFALALLVALALVGCGSGRDSSGRSAGSQSSDFNDADATFAQSMIPHHQQGVMMAQMAQMHASVPEVKQLADRMEAAQGSEITSMTRWLKAWGKDVPSGRGIGRGIGMGIGMGGDSGGMPGMMSEDDMMGLNGATGTGFDRMFLTMMIEHHTGGIEMAKTQQMEGQNEAAVALAKRIEADQTAEIAHMKDLLES